MNAAEVGGIVRTVLAALGGLAVGKGWIDNETMIAMVGAIVTIGTGVWSVFQKRSAA